MIGWHIRRDELVDVMNDKTKAIILNNPHNPTGEKGEDDKVIFIFLADFYLTTISYNRTCIFTR